MTTTHRRPPGPTGQQPAPRHALLPRPVGRRGLLLGGLATAGLGLSGCAGLTHRVGPSAGRSRDRLSVQVYGTDVEVAFYERLARRFEEQRPGRAVDLVAVPFAEASASIDAGLASGTAPDVFRVDYPTMGVYASAGQLLDVGAAMDGLAGDVPQALVDAVSHEGVVHGLPQHVDTSAVVYRPEVLREAGVTSVPERIEDAWSWEEFADVAARVAQAVPDGSSAFAVNWQAFGAFRWLNWLFQAGGHVYGEDLTTATLDTAPARRALEFTAGFFERGWVPEASSTKAAVYPDALFTSGSLGMLFAGNFLLPAFAETIADRFAYAVTYLPRDQRSAGELGGNALVATRDATNPELAADFLAFLGEPQQMRDFCEASVLLPTRASLLEQRLDFAVAADLMPVFAEQATTIEPRDVADVTSPTSAELNLSLANELEQCFLGGRSVTDTLATLQEQVTESAVLNREESS